MPQLASNRIFREILDANTNYNNYLFGNKPYRYAPPLRKTSNAKERLKKALQKEKAAGLGSIHADLENAQKHEQNLRKKFSNEMANIEKKYPMIYSGEGTFMRYKNAKAFANAQKSRNELSKKYSVLFINSRKKINALNSAKFLRHKIIKRNANKNALAILSKAIKPAVHKLLYAPGTGTRVAEMLNRRNEKISRVEHAKQIRELQREIKRLSQKK